METLKKRKEVPKDGDSNPVLIEVVEENENKEKICKCLTTHCPNGKVKRKSDQQSEVVETLKNRKEAPKDDDSDPMLIEVVEENENKERRCKFLTTHCPNGKAINYLKRQSDEQNKVVETLKKRKEVPKDDDSDPVLTFFRSMALTVKDLGPNLIVEAKSRILAVVSELEMKSLQST
ncbi:hypothetical protein ILUMI_14769 [Ignelater luminosus]|uniref:BESS domain-containing protein n=1 Tax=Ignelater luminosus TaxID=2038154 RepID=A0A8K0G9R0_IGNLU|nr:hypothetical protein ILUMI_14769 [Ignelater luminosus]